jgi:hypothetical protein
VSQAVLDAPPASAPPARSGQQSVTSARRSSRSLFDGGVLEDPAFADSVDPHATATLGVRASVGDMFAAVRRIFC